MKTPHSHPKYRILSSIAFCLAAALLLLSGCGQEKADTAKVEANAEEHDHDHGEGAVFASVSHSHETAGDTCFICDPSKRDKGRLWCREHNRYEDRCWLCHPELEDKTRMWCKEHSLYEDECYLCHPELKKEADSSALNLMPGQEAHGAQSDSPVLFCNEHNVAEAECGICQPDLAAFLMPGDDMKVRFLSPDSARKAGIQTELPHMSESAPVIAAFCETQYNLNTMAKVTPLVGGIIRRVHKDVGDSVIAGEALVDLHSAEVASAKSAYLSAIVEQDIRKLSFERETRLKEQSVTSEKELLEAEAAYRTTRLAVSNLRQRLVNLGLLEDEIFRVENEQDTSAHLVIRAPFGGTLVERKSVIGEAVETGHALFTLADLSTRWLEISIPSDHVGKIHVGQPVEASFPELPGITIRGSLSWVGTSVDPKTRMVPARALITRNVELITTGLFGDIYIAIGKERSTSIVPSGSIQRHEGTDFVFVQDAPDLFALRRVALGNRKGGNVQVLAGLNARDSVVTDGSFIVMSEFLKSRLGAGCADH